MLDAFLLELPRRGLAVDLVLDTQGLAGKGDASAHTQQQDGDGQCSDQVSLGIHVGLLSSFV
jgi:hypothetical protein